MHILMLAVVKKWCNATRLQTFTIPSCVLISHRLLKEAMQFHTPTHIQLELKYWEKWWCQPINPEAGDHQNSWNYTHETW